MIYGNAAPNESIIVNPHLVEFYKHSQFSEYSQQSKQMSSGSKE